jgi:hypothetical protein
MGRTSAPRKPTGMLHTLKAVRIIEIENLTGLIRFNLTILVEEVSKNLFKILSLLNDWNGWNVWNGLINWNELH